MLPKNMEWDVSNWKSWELCKDLASLIFVRIFGFQGHREDKKEKKPEGLSALPNAKGSLDFFFSVTPRVKGLDEGQDDEFAHETFQSNSGLI